MVIMSPEFLSMTHEVEGLLQEFHSKVTLLRTKHSNRLKIDFVSDEKQQEQEVEDATHDATVLLRKAEALVQRLAPPPEPARTDDADDRDDERERAARIGPAERLMRQNVQTAMARRVQAANQTFRAMQKDYLARVRALKSGTAIGAAAGAAGGAGGAEFGFGPAGAGTGGVGFFSSVGEDEQPDTGFSLAQDQIANEMRALADERDQEILRIARSVEELTQMFKELAVLVVDQGTILDRIDYNIEEAVKNVGDGMIQLQKAEDHQKDAMSVKCIAVLVILIIIMVGVLALKNSGKKKD